MKNLKILDSTILRKYLKAGRKLKVAIVGNSGVEDVDQKIISDSDVVVRFNNYATRQSISHTDDKFKCDILFSTFDLHSYKANPKDVIIGIPFPFKAKEIDEKPKKWYPESSLWMVNPYENMNMCRELKVDSLGSSHPLPSIGFTALWHMKNWDCVFYVAGFSWYYDKKTGLFQGWNLENKNYPANWNHNYPKEIEWIIKNLQPKNNIIFSRSCNKILSIAKKQLCLI